MVPFKWNWWCEGVEDGVGGENCYFNYLQSKYYIEEKKLYDLPQMH